MTAPARPEPPAPRRLPDGPAVPALVALAACGLATLLVLLPRTGPDARSLQARADAAVAAGDADTAALLYQHLLALEPQVSAHVVDWARALDRLGRRREAVPVLGTVAPDSGGGDPAAHLLLAQWLVEARMLGGVADDAVLRRAAAHLDAAAADPRCRSEAGDLRRVVTDLLARDASPTPPAGPSGNVPSN